MTTTYVKLELPADNGLFRHDIGSASEAEHTLTQVKARWVQEDWRTEAVKTLQKAEDKGATIEISGRRTLKVSIPDTSLSGFLQDLSCTPGIRRVMQAQVPVAA